MSDHQALERRYRILLRSYPAGYRRERADELLDIVLGEAPARRRWPELRQAAALIRGGLRVRGGGAAQRPAAVLFWQGMHLAAMAVLALGALVALDDTVEAFQFGGIAQPWTVLRDFGPNVVLVTAALGALASGRQAWAAGLVLAAITIPTAVSLQLAHNGMPQWWAPIVAAPLVLAGLRRPGDVPPVERGNAITVTTGVLALHLLPLDRLTTSADPMIVALAVAVTVTAAATFLWFATADQRLLLALAPTFLLVTLHQLTVGSLDLSRVDAVPSLLVGIALAAGALASARHRRTLI